MNRPSPVGMMLQFAFGPGPTSARLSSSPAMHASGTVACETAPQLLALAAAAKAWWECGRPDGWTLEQHLADPTAGRDGSEAERALADAVGEWLRQGS